MNDNIDASKKDNALPPEKKDITPVALDNDDAPPNKVAEPDSLTRFVLQLKNGEALKEAPKIVCKACHFTITSPLFLIPVNQRSSHVFTNPSGMSFDIQTFEIANGCIVSGTFTNHFSWFPGFLWQYAYCEGCGEHLGWHYKSEDTSNSEDMRFFGLITDHLKFQD